MEYYLDIKQNKMLPFATTWIDLEGIMLNEIISQRNTNTMISLICRTQNNNQKNQAHR